MKELLDKISSYNIFNYLLPGVIYSVVMDQWSNVTFMQESFITNAFFFYFIGLVISRVGSMVVEPLLRKTGFVKFSEYSDFVKVEKDDKKLEILSEVNNMYRTLISLFLLVLSSKTYLMTAKYYEWKESTNIWAVSFCLLIIFLFSYRKQTSYITKRIKAKLK